ncbi:Nedd8-activating enzyme E1 regulatory subunit [Pseudolycoriella hygida]|uniref:NEDD8-activating enzyme E1 regulatory subunit n=1 Tax=Pseudolycoriella hygida TaxID=35572 RepID=A0A9Q0S5I0_9DIPT|nr:Nedd8-activating enzyme E1 regulatory subunit [Pseudolycoriella hygida]
MSSPAIPKSPELSDKNRKYDRQIRLWGEQGQTLLEAAQVCLINVNAIGTEVLKGIVLPGIGGFTIVDAGIVTEEDIGCNFFLDQSSLGLSRAKAAMQLLQELNPDVRGDYVDESVEYLLQNNPDFFRTFNVVVASSIKETTIIALSEKLWQLEVPFIFCRSVGFIATARIQVKEHCIVESHPDDKLKDLRLHHPFPSLKEHLESSDVTSKVPWLCVVYKFLQKWRGSDESKVPTTHKEKLELKKLIHSGMTKDEENFEEAVVALNSCFSGGRPTKELLEILEDRSCNNLTKESKLFWILVRSLNDFLNVDSDGWLPVPGVLPDMTAETAHYINLQNIYRSQANQDASLVYNHAQNHLRSLNLSSDLITESDVKLFCREAATISLLRGTKIADEYEKCLSPHTIASELEMPNSLMEYYIVLRAFDRFQSEHGGVPGECHVEADTARIKSIANRLLSDWGVTHPFSDELAHEICRYGGTEIHSVSAFMGGCVAHEVIKLITQQYKPINNTVIYSAITSSTATYRM